MEGLATPLGTEQSSPRAQEPAGMTLADLVVLVVAFGLVMALPRVRYHAAIGPAPEWFARFDLLVEVLQRTCAALGLVILARRARYGGLGRPVELLVLFCAMPMLAGAVEHLPVIVNSRRAVPAVGAQMFVPGAPYWWWKRGAAIGCVATLLAFLLLRRKLPGWAKLALLSLALLTFWGGGTEYLFRAFDLLIGVTGLQGDARAIAEESIGVLILGLVYGLPAASALIDRRRAGWTWIDWIGAGLASAFLALVIGLGYYEIWWAPMASAVVPAIAVGTSVMVLSVALSLVLAWRLGPAWRRWIGPKPGPEAVPLAPVT